MVQTNPEYQPPAAAIGLENNELIPDYATLLVRFPPALHYLGWFAIVKNATYTKLYQCRFNGVTYEWIEILGAPDYFDPVLDKDLLVPPILPAIGDAYGVAWGGGIAGGLWTGQELTRAEWDGANWIFQVPDPGTICFVIDEALNYMFDGTGWNIFGVGIFHTLDAAYDDGRTINADAGAVVINNAIADATNALEVTKVSGLGYAISSTGRNLITHTLADATNALNINKTNGSGAAIRATNGAGTNIVEICRTGNEPLKITLAAAGATGIFIDQITNPLTVPRNMIDVGIQINNVNGFVSGLSVIGADSAPNINISALFGTSIYQTMLDTSSTIMIGHYVQIDGKRSVSVPDYGMYINASHEIDDGGAYFTGVSIQENGITLTNFGSLTGLYVEMPDDVNGTSNPIRGIQVLMPNPYNGAGDMDAAQFDGDGRVVHICSNTYAIETTGDVYINGKLTVTGGIDPDYLELNAGVPLTTYLNMTDGRNAAVSAASEGRMRYNANTQKFQISQNGGAYNDLLVGSGGVPTLDLAYDGGGSGLGRTITADSGAVVINNAVADATNALEINRTVGTGSGISITSGVNSLAAINAVISGNYGMFFDNSTTKITSDKNYIMIDGQMNVAGANVVRGVYFNIFEAANISAQVVGFLAQVEHFSTSSMQNWAFYHKVQGTAQNSSDIRTVWSDVNGTLNGANVTYRGLFVDDTDATLTNFLSIYGAHINFTKNTAVNNPYYGIYVQMPAAYTGTGIKGLYMTGDGRTVEICNNTEAIKLTLPATENGIVIDNNATAITGSKNIISEQINIGVAIGSQIYGLYQSATFSGASNSTYAALYSIITPNVASSNFIYGAYIYLNPGSSFGGNYIAGFHFDPNTLTVNNAAAQLWGAFIRFDQTTLTSFSICRGIDISMHTTMVANEIGIRVSGDNKTVDIGTQANGIYCATTSAITTTRQMISTLQVIGNLAALSADGIRNSFTFSADSGGASVFGSRTSFTPRGNQAGHSVNHYGFRTEITPSGAITGASQFYGYQFTSGVLTLNNAAVIEIGFDAAMSGIVATNYLQIFGIRLLMPNDPTPVNRAIHGIDITMPGAYTGTAIRGIRVTGDGRTLDICDTNYALNCQGEARFTNYLDMTGGSGFWFRPPSMTSLQRTAMVAGWGASDAGKEWYNSTTGQWEGWNGAAIVIIG